jgi:hypothetical protein
VFKSRKATAVTECQAEPRSSPKLYLQATTVGAPRGQTPLVRVHPGREQVNFSGALNRHTGQEIVLRAKVINGATTASHLLWDRAPWHFGPAIQPVLAAQERLQVMHFPVAAPELNPQEQVWKAVRRAISHHHPVARLAALADPFEEHLNTTTCGSSFLERYGFNLICPMFK